MSSPSTNTETAVIPAVRSDGLPRPGTYRCAAGRCILELSAGVGLLTTVRGRLAVTDNTLTVDDDTVGSTLKFEADSASLRTTRPLVTRRLVGRQGLNARRHRTIRFVSAAAGLTELIEMAELTGSTMLTVPGTLYVRDASIDLGLDVRVVARDQKRLLVTATGRVSYRDLREACGVRLPWTVPAGYVQIMFAGDFR